jgi:diguanylate cyclase (GGDEF)-like protein
VSGSLLLIRGMRALLSATRRLAAGDFAARSRFPYGHGEVGELAQAFDHMAMTLEGQRDELARQREGLERINRVYAVTSAINALIIRVRDYDSLLRSACEIAVSQGRFACAWIGETRPGDLRLAHSWHAGGEDAPAELLPVAGEWVTDRRSAMLAALHEGRIGVDNDIGRFPWTEPWQDAASEAGYRACIHLPLRRGERIVACLLLFSEERGFFDEQEVQLMKDLAADLSLALDYLDKAERLQYLAYNDAVTGLPNASLFRDRLRQSLLQQRRRKGQLAVLVMTLEQQDDPARQRRHMSDALLQETSQRLLGCLRATDTVSRLHEEEFGVLLDTIKTDADVPLAVQKLRECFAAPLVVQGVSFAMRARVGVALYPQDGREAEALIERAAARLEQPGEGAAPLSLRR